METLSPLIFATLALYLTSAALAWCPSRISFVVGLRKSTKTANDDGICIVTFQDNLFKKDTFLEPSVTGELPTYVAIRGRDLFATNGISPEGALTRVTFSRREPFVKSISAPTSKDRSTHLSLLGRVVAVANFAGSVDTFVVSRRSIKRVDSFIVPQELASVNKDPTLRNPFTQPHPHMALPYKRGILVPDLGSDLLFYFDVSREGHLDEISRNPVSIGDGPRHAAVHRRSNTIYVLTEISLKLLVMREKVCGSDDIGECDRRELLNTAPTVDRVKAAAIRISADGRFVYASVRFPGEIPGKIVGFQVDPRSGNVIKKIGEWTSCGIHPRDFIIVERARGSGGCKSFIAVANRDTDNIVLMERNRATGVVTEDCDARSFTLNSPTSILQN